MNPSRNCSTINFKSSLFHKTEFIILNMEDFLDMPLASLDLSLRYKLGDSQPWTLLSTLSTSFRDLSDIGSGPLISGQAKSG